MRNSIRDAARVALNTYPLSRFRSIEERLGILAFALMLLFAMTQGLLAHEFKAGNVEIVPQSSGATPDGAKVTVGSSARSPMKSWQTCASPGCIS